MHSLISASKLRRNDRCTRIGDIVYIPEQLSSREAEKARRQMFGNKLLLQVFAETIPGAHPEIYSPITALGVLLIAHDKHFSRHGKEPAWVEKAPRLIRRYIRYSAILTDPEYRPMVIQLRLPYAGFGFMVLQDGIIEDTCHAFGLYRLEHVRQLAFLHDPLAREGDGKSCGALFTQDRFEHIVNAPAFAQLMAVNLGLDEHDLRHLVVAATAHDALTPAGGDTTKLLGPELFDEDRHFRNVFRKPGWQQFREKYGLSETLLEDTVQGNGLLGQLLDLSDKLSYVSRDANNFTDAFPHMRPATCYPRGYYEICRLLDTQPHVCTLWDSVELCDGQLAVGDADKLGCFLKLRALLFQQLYNNPRSRYCEFFLAVLTLRKLEQQGRLDKDKLLSMMDFELEELISQEVGIPDAMHWLQFNIQAEEYPTLTHASFRERQLRQAGIRAIVTEDLSRQASTGERIRVIHKGRTVPFGEAFPCQARELRAILNSCCSVRLLYTTDERINKLAIADTAIA